jgi:hypothetical protein
MCCGGGEEGGEDDLERDREKRDSDWSKAYMSYKSCIYLKIIRSGKAHMT